MVMRWRCRCRRRDAVEPFNRRRGADAGNAVALAVRTAANVRLMRGSLPEGNGAQLSTRRLAVTVERWRPSDDGDPPQSAAGTVEAATNRGTARPHLLEDIRYEKIHGYSYSDECLSTKPIPDHTTAKPNDDAPNTDQQS